MLFALLPLVLAADPVVRMEPLTYDALAKRVADGRGKVVLVDAWMTNCVPCLRELPHFVALHDRHAAAGLHAISVCLDDPADAAAPDRARAVLTRQRATGLNVLLDAPAAVWQAKWKIDGPPYVAVFDRRGRLVETFRDAAVDYATIGPLVERLLRE